MGKTIRKYKGKEYRDKSVKPYKHKKFFGFTSGVHSRFEDYKKSVKDEFENTDVDNPFYPIIKKLWDKIKDKTHPIKGEDFIKYGYGNGMKNKNIKHYKQDLETSN